MRVAHIQFTPWDKLYDFDPQELLLNIGDKVVVKTDLGLEIGDVVGFKDCKCEVCPAKTTEIAENKEEVEKKEREVKPILRKATAVDLEKLIGKEEKREALNYCKTMVKKHGLIMKLVDAHFSYDGSRITFAFIADGRVDFRELVKDLTKHFNRTIRLHQIGIRDEAKIMGDSGHCGRILCCKSHLKELVSITSEMAEQQQVVHRGSERISGICGRLMCCLAYETCGYKDLASNLPPLGVKVNVDGRKGIVVGHHILKQSVNVQFKGEKDNDYTVEEVDLNRNKKK